MEVRRVSYAIPCRSVPCRIASIVAEAHGVCMAYVPYPATMRIIFIWPYLAKEIENFTKSHRFGFNRMWCGCITYALYRKWSTFVRSYTTLRPNGSWMNTQSSSQRWCTPVRLYACSASIKFHRFSTRYATGHYALGEDIENHMEIGNLFLEKIVIVWRKSPKIFEN